MIGSKMKYLYLALLAIVLRISVALETVLLCACAALCHTNYSPDSSADGHRLRERSLLFSENSENYPTLTADGLSRCDNNNYRNDILKGVPVDAT